MNRERAETHLRLLAEAELRRHRVEGPGAFAGPVVAPPATIARAAWALTAVQALDPETVDGILADADLALAVRSDPGASGASGGGLPGPAAVAWPGQRGRPGSVPVRLARPWTAGQPRTAVASQAGAGAGTGTERYVPLGRLILFHDETISGEFALMAYVHTAAGARLVATWRARDPLGPWRPVLPPVDRFAVSDDRGGRYRLVFKIRGQPESACDLFLRPEPPAGIGWLEVTAPGDTQVRISLARAAAGPAAAAVSPVDLSPGEHLLNRIAERLLTMAPHAEADLSLRRARVSLGPLTDLAEGLGDMVSALEAAEALSPLSPVPGRLAALCANLYLGGHGITAPPADDLPVAWLSLLSHFHRRKPGIASAWDDFAALAASLPELDGIRLVLLGLHHSDGDTWMNTLVIGQLPDRAFLPRDLETAFPLSVWVRDDAARWHAARPAGWCAGEGEHMLTLRLVPPLARPADWIEVQATGPSAEVRAELPVRWGDRP